jgi:hypothetical protein
VSCVDELSVKRERGGQEEKGKDHILSWGVIRKLLIFRVPRQSHLVLLVKVGWRKVKR